MDRIEEAARLEDVVGGSLWDQLVSSAVPRTKKDE